MNEEILQIDSSRLANQQYAVGNDLVFLPDFELALTPSFKEKVYTTREVDYCEQFKDSLARYASTWAAKEAVYKALKQIHEGPIPFNKIEIIRKAIGKQPLVLLGKQLKLMPAISLSITHDGAYAWAIALVERK